jgi:hypothetical protein
LLLSAYTLEMYKFYLSACVRQTGSQAWIGDHGSFSIYQDLYHLSDGATHPLMKPLPGDLDGLNFSSQIIDQKHDAVHARMSRAMQAIIRSGATPVGGVPISLVLADSCCRFWPYVHAAARPNPSVSHLPFRDPLFGDAAAGDYSYDIVCAKDALENLVAVHFHFVNIAYVFRRWDGGIPYLKKIPDVSIERMSPILEEMFGITIWNVKIDRDPLGSYRIDADMPKGA